MIINKTYGVFILLFYAIFSHGAFEFRSYKTGHKALDGALRTDFFDQVRATFNCGIFVETGTSDGSTTLQATRFFKEIHTIELHPELFGRSRRRLAPHAHVKVYNGSSPSILKQILPTLHGSVLFWLDAHYSGEGTALNAETEYDPTAITPICDELRAIKESSIQDCVILIDDVRLFSSVINDAEYHCCWGFPSINEVVKILKEINENFEIVILGDILLSYDRTKYTVATTPTVKACTASRLFDGSEMSSEQLMSFETEVMKATPIEEQYISLLYSIMCKNNYSLFHYDLWHALILLKQHHYSEAQNILNRILHRSSESNPIVGMSRQSMPYTDSRIQRYLDWAIYNAI